MTRKINTRDLVSKIERLTRDRMRQESVLNIEQLRRLKERKVQRTVLLIEDDDTIRAGLKRVFESEGYRVRDVADGTQLVNVLDDERPDLIILDVGLPWINGYELAEMMKSHEDLKDIPLVFLTARNSTEDIQQGFKIGADDYITKPFEIEQVKKVVSALMQLAHD